MADPAAARHCPVMRSVWKHRTLGEVMVIGGVELYVMALPLCERIYLTEIHANLSGNTWFPEL